MFLFCYSSLSVSQMLIFSSSRCSPLVQALLLRKFPVFRSRLVYFTTSEAATLDLHFGFSLSALGQVCLSAASLIFFQRYLWGLLKLALKDGQLTPQRQKMSAQDGAENHVVRLNARDPSRVFKQSSTTAFSGTPGDYLKYLGGFRG